MLTSAPAAASSSCDLKRTSVVARGDEATRRYTSSLNALVAWYAFNSRSVLTPMPLATQGPDHASTGEIGLRQRAVAQLIGETPRLDSIVIGKTPTNGLWTLNDPRTMNPGRTLDLGTNSGLWDELWTLGRTLDLGTNSGPWAPDSGLLSLTPRTCIPVRAPSVRTADALDSARSSAGATRRGRR